MNSSPQANYINLADKLTQSPRTEYSLLLPEVPTTPANATPVAIPTLHLHSSSFNKDKPVKIALIGSS